MRAKETLGWSLGINTVTAICNYYDKIPDVVHSKVQSLVEIFGASSNDVFNMGPITIGILLATTMKICDVLRKQK